MSNSLKNYGLLKISGIDAKKFLQGQLTCNLDEINPQEDHCGAHCNPQGRVISLFNIFLYHDDYYLLMIETMIPIARQALQKYAVFFKVKLDAIPMDMAPISMMNATTMPHIYPETSGKFLPHELNLQLTNAISFNKGCYTGQEIIARMHYRGKLKKRMFRASLIASTPPLPRSDIYYHSNQELQTAGTIIDSAYITPEQHWQVFLVCDDEHAKNEHLFLEYDPQTFLIFS